MRVRRIQREHEILFELLDENEEPLADHDQSDPRRRLVLL